MYITDSRCYQADCWFSMVEKDLFYFNLLIGTRTEVQCFVDERYSDKLLTHDPGLTTFRNKYYKYRLIILT